MTALKIPLPETYENVRSQLSRTLVPNSKSKGEKIPSDQIPKKTVKIVKKPVPSKQEKLKDKIADAKSQVPSEAQELKKLKISAEGEFDDEPFHAYLNALRESVNGHYFRYRKTLEVDIKSTKIVAIKSKKKGATWQSQ